MGVRRKSLRTLFRRHWFSKEVIYLDQESANWMAFLRSKMWSSCIADISGMN